ncbi:MAG: hypothetical protein QMD71_07510 [bacterium]|nr:hypothetical protein [bacterium]
MIEHNVYILGAGASKSAGYPLGNELLSRLAKDAKSSCELGRKEEQKRFETWMQEQQGVIPEAIRKSGNPEFILTYLDLGIAVFEYNIEKNGGNCFLKI